MRARLRQLLVSPIPGPRTDRSTARAARLATLPATIGLLLGLNAVAALAWASPPGRSVWNTGTVAPAVAGTPSANAPAPPGTSAGAATITTSDRDRELLPLRVYEGFAALGPLYGADTPLPGNANGVDAASDVALAVDVVAEFARCADGSRIVTGLSIGGNHYPLANRCREGSAPRADATGALRCDARRWSCRSQP